MALEVVVTIFGRRARTPILLRGRETTSIVGRNLNPITDNPLRIVSVMSDPSGIGVVRVLNGRYSSGGPAHCDREEQMTHLTLRYFAAFPYKVQVFGIKLAEEDGVL